MKLTIFGVRCALITSAIVFAFGVSHGIVTASSYSQGPVKWTIGAKPDPYQFLDDSVPVFVFRVVQGPEDPAQGKNDYTIKETILENRSSKNVESVTLRWLITPMEDNSTVLLQGQLAPVKLSDLFKSMIAGHRQTLKLSTPKIASLLKQLPNTASNKFMVLIGVSKVVFEDGTIWEAEMKTSGTNGL